LSVHSYLEGRIDLQLREVTAGHPFEIAGFAVEGHETRHSMDGLAYRFAEGVDDSPMFVFSGDSEAFAGLGRFANDCRVLAHDCSFPDGVDVSGHPTPTQLGRALADCAVDRLYLTHLYPHTDGKHDEMRTAVSTQFSGEVRIARDGLQIRL
jgi:ribonuclease BN (tRNA processing enzyme)